MAPPNAKVMELVQDLSSRVDCLSMHVRHTTLHAPGASTLESFWRLLPVSFDSTQDSFVERIDQETVHVWALKKESIAVLCPCPIKTCNGLIFAGQYAPYVLHASASCVHCGT